RQHGAAMLLPGEDQVLAHGELGEDLQQLERAAHAEAVEIARAHAGDGVAVEVHVAGARRELAEDAVEQGRLAAAVRTDDAEDLAGAHLGREAGHRDDAAERLLQVAHLEDAGHRSLATALDRGLSRRSARPSRPAGQMTISTITRTA